MQELSKIESIDVVIKSLDEIISNAKLNKDPVGYFAALYQKVTIKVQEGIERNFFDDGVRMEKLDVVFAKRYLEAYVSYINGQTTTTSWEKVFVLSTKYWPIVLQHLLIGMNAHINLDLGIAAAEISNQQNIDDLESDFKKINTILSTLVHEVEEDLSELWPTLKIILKKTRKVDDFLIDFSMELARDGAWKFAKALSGKTEEKRIILINQRDLVVSEKAKLITSPGMIPNILMGIIRIGEKGSVFDRIDILKSMNREA